MGGKRKECNFPLFLKDSILDRLNLPQDAKMRVELALLRQCLVAGGGL